MANPTVYYNWTLPYEGQDPWVTALEDAFNSVDTSIHSVSLISRPRSTLVLSLVPTAGIDITSATGTDFSTDGVWTICSAAPYGRFVGSFSTIGSGASIALTLYVAPYLTVAAGSLHGTAVGDMRFRVVGGKTGASSMNLTGNSAWFYRFTDTNNRHGMAFQAVTSVGIGNFSVELQGHYVAILASTCSKATLGSGAPVTLFAAEVTPGT